MSSSDANLLPTVHDEAWRYGDLKALERVWPLPDAPERIEVAAGERASRIIGELPVRDGVGVLQLDIDLAESARFDLHCLVYGADYGRVEVAVRCTKGAHFELGGAILGAGDQTLEIVSQVTHAEPDGTSNQVVRCVLADHATGSFLGKVAVAKDAQKTDAEQSVKSILLDRTATANAKPELEIYADDVLCAHGATVGELDKQALFYLASRGLPPVEARRMMIQAFIADAFVGIEDNRTREAIEENALNLLEKLG